MPVPALWRRTRPILLFVTFFHATSVDAQVLINHHQVLSPGGPVTGASTILQARIPAFC